MLVFLPLTAQIPSDFPHDPEENKASRTAFTTDSYTSRIPPLTTRPCLQTASLGDLFWGRKVTKSSFPKLLFCNPSTAQRTLSLIFFRPSFHLNSLLLLLLLLNISGQWFLAVHPSLSSELFITNGSSSCRPFQHDAHCTAGLPPQPTAEDRDKTLSVSLPFIVFKLTAILHHAHDSNVSPQAFYEFPKQLFFVAEPQKYNHAPFPNLPSSPQKRLCKAGKKNFFLSSFRKKK